MANEKLKKLSSFLLNLPIKVKSIIISDKQLYDLIIKANLDQLKQGQRADGSELPRYSDTSVLVYNKPAGAIKLYDTGDFYKGIRIEVKNSTETTIKLVGTDDKTEMLQSEYGKEIIGISLANLTEIEQNYIKNKITDLIKNLEI